MKVSIYRNERFLRGISTARDVLRIGRLPSCELNLEGESVARYHAIIERSPSGGWRVVNVAPGGTLLNGKQVTRAKLRAGDEVSVGGYKLVLDESSTQHSPEREVIRHPNIYEARRGSVQEAPAARSRPSSNDPSEISIAKRRFGWIDALITASVIGGAILYLLQA